MSNIFSLFKLFFGAIFSSESFVGEIKKGPKGIIKLVLLGLLFLYVLGAFGAIMVLTLLGVYKNLAGYGMQNLMPTFSFLFAAIGILFFGFIAAATNYYTGGNEEQLLSMPLKPKEIFTAKYLVSSVSDGILGAFILGTAGIIYGYNEGHLANPLFWITLICSIVFLVCFVLFVIYVLLILFLTVFPFLRKKKILTSIASVLTFVFAITFSLLSSSISSSIVSDGGLTGFVTGETAARFSKVGKISAFFESSFSGNILCALVFLAFSALIIFVLVPLISKFYINTLDGFSDVKSKKYSATEISKSLENETKGRSLFKALLIKDIHGVLREPSFFANGPLFIIIMPLIMVVSMAIGFFSASKGDSTEVLFSIQQLIQTIDGETLKIVEFWFILVGSIYVSFLGVNANIASTAFSREGKGLANLKAMPITFKNISQAKIVHSLIYCILSYIEFALIFSAILGLVKIPFSAVSVVRIFLLTFMLGFAISFFMIYIDILLDAFNPKINWENPIHAFKKNVNTLFSVLGTMAVAALIVYACIKFQQFGIYTLLGLVLVFALLTFGIRFAYYKYGEKKFWEM